MASAKSRDHSLPLFKQLRILPLYNIYELCVSVTMFKFMKKLVPNELNDLFVTNDEIHSYPTRQRHQLRAPRARTSLRQKTFTNKGVNIWNQISVIINHNCSLSVFKSRVKQHFLNEL